MSIPHNQSITQNQKNANTLLAAALEYAQRGWPVLPLKPRGKQPLTPHGVKDAVTDAETIRAWWRRWPEANIGIATGKTSGLIVLDIDGPEGEEFIAATGTPLQTPTVRTGKGRHLYFKHPGGTVRNFARRVPGLDLRGDGGYVVAPPSIHPDGTAYIWEIPPDVSLADTPEWLMALIRQKERAGNGRETGEYWLSRALAQATPGNRNDVGFWLACQLRDGGLSMAEAEPYMLRYAAAAPGGDHDYTEQEALASLQSAYSEPPREPARTTPQPHKKQKTTRDELLTDLGNCLRFVEQHKDNLRYCPNLGWLVWDGRRWRPDNGAAMRAAKKTALKLYDEAIDQLELAESTVIQDKAAARRGDQDKAVLAQVAGILKDATKRLAWALQSQNRQRLEAMVALAQSEQELIVYAEALDKDPYLLNVLNGTIDLRTGELRPHRKEDFITKLAPVEYTPDARDEIWEKYLADATDGDHELIAYLQRAVGYTLTGVTDEEVVFLVLGDGKTGKSTFISALEAVLGDYAVKASFETFLAQHRNGDARPDLVQMRGARFVAAVESPKGRRLNEVEIKELSGGDTVTARTLYKEPITFRPSFKLWLATNYAPEMNDTDNALWRRIRTIPFRHVIPAPDPNVKHHLTTDAGARSAILAWAIRGCLEWQGSGLGDCPRVRDATTALRASFDPLTEFLDTCCIIQPNATVAAGDLWQAYREWTAEMGTRPVSNKEWGERLRRLGCKEELPRTGQGRKKVWRGIGLVMTTPQQAQGTKAPAAPSPHCAICGNDVWIYAPDGTPYCEEHAKTRGIEPPSAL